MTGQAAFSSAGRNSGAILDAGIGRWRLPSCAVAPQLDKTVIVALFVGSTEPQTVGGVYDQYAYLTKKRDALERWATSLKITLASEDKPSNVVELRRA